MTDAEIISTLITVLAVFAGSLYTNACVGNVVARFDDIDERTDNTAAVISAEMNLQFERINNKLDAVLKLVTHIDQCVRSLEARK